MWFHRSVIAFNLPRQSGHNKVTMFGKVRRRDFLEIDRRDRVGFVGNQLHMLKIYKTTFILRNIYL